LLKVLVAGASGQLGQALVKQLGERLVWSGGREDLDVTDAAAVFARLQAVRPDVVVNASAYNKVDAAQDDPESAFLANAVGPVNLARACAELGARFVHVSTDYVFDGTKTAPYLEDDVPRPRSVYGLSKRAGELNVLSLGQAALIVRTSGVLGAGGSRAKGGSFVERILDRARRGEALRVVNDQVFAPTYAPDLAAALLALVEAGTQGIVHVTNTGSCTWHALAQQALREAGLPATVEPIASTDLGLKAPRPPYSVLSTTRYRSLGLPALRPWQDALAELVSLLAV
jgi:dTDP-4-dehydrorhamnose reductase